MRRTALLLAFTLAVSLTAEVRLCGIQGEDLTLKPENNPYIITGDVVIQNRTLWNVNPGVVIKIASAATCSSGKTLYEAPDKGRLIAVVVKGAFQCVGKSARRIRFEPFDSTAKGVTWYGLVFEGARDEFCKLYYTDISGALYGVKIRECSPLVRNCLITRNQTGLFTQDLCQSKIHNNNIVNNLSTGILNENATPLIFSNLIAWNPTGIWSDLKSKVEIEYNAFWQNADGHFNQCPPKYGVLSTVNKRKDSCDYNHNIFMDPVLWGSASHADSIKKDIRVPTDTTADVADKKLSRVVVKAVPDTLKSTGELNKPHKPWQYSRYSRLTDAGTPKSAYKDADNSPNDIGLNGCAEFKFE